MTLTAFLISPALDRALGPCRCELLAVRSIDDMRCRRCSLGPVLAREIEGILRHAAQSVTNQHDPKFGDGPDPLHRNVEFWSGVLGLNGMQQEWKR